MTTGPIAVNAVENRPAYRITDKSSGPPTVQNLNVVSRYFVHRRPMSKNGAFINGGAFRLPTSYYHQGCLAVSGFSEVILSRNSVPPGPNQVTAYRWIDGGFWSLPQLTSPDPFPAWLQSLALIKALEKLKAQRVNYAVAFAEGRKTIQMVGDSIHTVANSILSWRRKNSLRLWDRVKRGGKQTPNSWLELQYGWNPLMSDVMGTCAALRDPWNRGADVSVKGYAQAPRAREDKISSPSGYSAYYVLRSEQLDRCWVKLWYHASGAELAALSSLGLTNPLALAWELVPYSFVLDWFLPVGDWLSVLDSDLGFSFITGRRAERQTVSRVSSEVYAQPVPGYSWTLGDPGMRYRLNYFNRVVYPNSPMPGLHFKSPLSLAHVANGLSLLASALDRR